MIARTHILRTSLKCGTSQSRGSLLRNESGSLLPMAAVGFLVLAGIIGGGVDLSRAHKAENRLQAACDAAVLAGRRAVGVNGFTTAVQSEAMTYFENNFDEESQGSTNVSFVPASDDNGNTVTGTAQADVNTALMTIFGVDSITVTVACSASMGVGNSDITMVLDSTGSMGNPLESGGPTKLLMLQDAMKDFYDTVKTATAGGNARVRYAFVPYSSSINVGRLLEAEWLVDTMDIQSREPVYETIETEEFSGWDDPDYSTSSGQSDSWVTGEGFLNDTEYSRRNDCSRDLPDDTSWTNSGSSATEENTTINGRGQQVTTTTETQRQTRRTYTCVKQQRGWGRWKTEYYVQYYTDYARDNYDYSFATRDPVMTVVTTEEFSHFAYKQLEYDVSSYKTFSSVTTPTGNNGSDVTSTWEGCIEERETTPAASFTFNSNQERITPVSANDLDIDSLPTSDNDTKWRPMWPEVAFYRTAWVSTRWGGYWDLTNAHETQYGGNAPSSCPYRAQLLQEMDEDDFDDYADSLIAVGNTYHDLGMIWGARLSSPQGIFADNVNQAPNNGGHVARHLIFMTDGAMQPSISIQGSYGIEFHDRRVTANGSNHHSRRHTERFLAVCQAVKAKGIRLWVIAFATGLTDDLETCASSESSFLAEDADQLNEAFQEIANEVGELRITQ
ncbi:TadE/TadG family type IV pilus assembly protein [Aurantiacibacter poecillastricola]|uniref:TadE/TadG family type IV pilus assembly protein n=1 Tax=Aurantiacibacter poecillastricola TaxID=3064385 RepID=UPI00273EE2DD|nr:TadE/TadG family type IV pilus assembly protein [Aurantiacibacter sp. 219JJ12-13]MDP5260623.1 Tad domain-containing protein [Aurantiacibacter sp. 219JJ12-13]